MQRERSDPTWDAIIAEILDERIDRRESTEIEFDDVEARVPVAFGEDAAHATWRVDGAVTVTVDGDRRPLAEWLRFWARYTTDTDAGETTESQRKTE
ncbi:hypothetical protein [Natronomonas sp.]|uniref:hypothetical protein n=1 Tax=Natronomonas sp. TaxID=2184060 RepID=UPI00262AF976|nr:hypothetical protein [Natronomonas sp.]